jgi:glucokinase
MRARYGRVSVERVVSGPGIDDIYAVLAGRGGHSAPPPGDLTIWRQGREGSDPLSSAAVERFCVLLGRAAGDYALAHGASGVVIAGGLGLRLRDVLPQSGFAAAFRDKGRYEAMMAAMPVKLLVHPQPGLYGAAVAFAASRD